MKTCLIRLVTALSLGFHTGGAWCQTDHGHEHHPQMNERGDHVMGFSHAKTTHHFRLYADGGSIEVTANDPADAAARDQIQMHLAHIAGMFSEGNFQAPMLIHGHVPPGVRALQRLKAAVSYQFEKSASGGMVRITTRNPEALKAVHQFLRFQISDHQTGDSPIAASNSQE